MNFDVGIWDTVFMVVAIGFAIWAHLDARRRRREANDHAADE